MKRKDENDIDLCACYEPEEPTPEEFIDPGDREPTLADTAIYITDENGVEYYCCGNTKIKITEHFAEEGKTMGELLEEFIIREAKKAAKEQHFKSLKLPMDSCSRLLYNTIRKYCKRGLFRTKEAYLFEATVQYRTLHETQP